MKIVKLEEWEQNQINSLTLKLIFAATIGTLVATGIAITLQRAGVPEIRPELLFAPWGIALVVGVSVAFHKGVQAERARVAGNAEENKK
jgi:hypothetical protein